jgi:transposase
VSGAHEVTEGGLAQFGHSKDDPPRPQIKVMIGALDPLGMPLATDVLSGERADDGLYIPLIQRIRTGLKTSGLLFVGDCNVSSLPILEKGEQFLWVIGILTLLCSHYKISLLRK